MKRLITLFCMVVALTACQKDWADPTQGDDAGLFNLSRTELDGMSFSLGEISDPGTITTPYPFFSVLSWDQWRRLAGEERAAAIEVPEDILKEMTTLALVKTVVNYPSLTDYAYAYNYPLAAMNALIERSALFQELVSRENAEDILIWAYGRATVDPLYLTDPDTAWANWKPEVPFELERMGLVNYEAFLILLATDSFDFSNSPYLDYFKAVTAARIGEKKLDLSGKTTYYFDPLLVIWDKYFGNLAPNICAGAYPYEF